LLLPDGRKKEGPFVKGVYVGVEPEPIKKERVKSVKPNE